MDVTGNWMRLQLRHTPNGWESRSAYIIRQQRPMKKVGTLYLTTPMASRFIAGDDLGNIKILWYSEGDAKTHVLEQKTVLSSESKATVQKLSIRQDGDESCLVRAPHLTAKHAYDYLK